MPRRAGQTTLSTHVDRELSDRFQAWARQEHGGTSQAFRQMIVKTLSDAPPIRPRGVGRGEQIGFKLKANERSALQEAAEARGTTPANWARSLALVHLARAPQWNAAELEALRAIGRELRAIGNNVNQIARAVNTASLAGGVPADQVPMAKEAADRVRQEMRRLLGVMSGNFDYWGLPDADRPTAARGAIAREDAAKRAAEARHRLRTRRRPARFAE